MMTSEEASKLTDRLAKQLNGRRPRLEERLGYYRGTEGKLRFASDEFSSFYQTRYQGFSDNWCAPVVQPTAERMNHLGIVLPGQNAADDDAHRIWVENDCERGSSEAYTVFSAAGFSHVLVSPNRDDPDTPSISWESPLQAIVDFDPRSGRRRAGLIFWVDENYDYATLYTPGEVWKWERRNYDTTGLDLPPSLKAGAGWQPRQPRGDDTWPIFNPLEEVPLLELRNQTLLDDVPISDISGVMAMQDTINLIWAYLLNALDYASLPQRIVTGADVPKVPVLDENGQVVASRPVDLNDLIKERIMWIPGADAETSEWSAAKLDVFSAVIDQAVEHIAAQTRTPPHYLMAKMVNTAASALEAAEAGLVSKVGERLTYVQRPHRQLYSLIFKALGDTQRAKEALSAELLWASPKYRSEAQMADASVKLFQADVYPRQKTLEDLGNTPTEIKRIEKMFAKEESSVIRRINRPVSQEIAADESDLTVAGDDGADS